MGKIILAGNKVDNLFYFVRKAAVFFRKNEEISTSEVRQNADALSDRGLLDFLLFGTISISKKEGGHHGEP